MQPPPSVPPPGYPQPPARKGMPVWAWVLIGCIPATFLVIIILAAILFPVFARAREKARDISCVSNEKEMSLALLQYAQDNDEHFPEAASWMDKTQPYTTSDHIYHCPSASHNEASQYGYAFSSSLDSKSLADVPHADIQTTPMFYDSANLSRNASDSGSSLPSPGRHLGSNNVAYIDGHVGRAGL